ncbi:MAG: ral secretion pathway protein [Verrucomicrobiota bacterium]|jgi:hypothetical protein
MKKMSILQPRIRGAALLLSLWALFLLSAMVMSWALDISSRFTLSGTANRALQAEALACSGAEIALHPSVQPGAGVLKGHPSSNQTYETNITGEGGRLNVNWLVAGEDPDRLEVLRKYLENKGVDLNERDRMIDSLLDWVEPNTGLHHLNGATDSENYHPAHTLLTRIDDLKKVSGWQEFTSTPGWDDEFTLNSTGPVDLAWASRDVLRSLPGMGDARVDQFLMLRRGPDQIDGTADDAKFKSIEEIGAALGFTPEQFQELSSLVGFNDQVMRVVSVGKSGDVTRVVQMVIRKAGARPQLITWKEF